MKNMEAILVEQKIKAIEKDIAEFRAQYNASQAPQPQKSGQPLKKKLAKVGEAIAVTGFLAGTAVAGKVVLDQGQYRAQPAQPQPVVYEQAVQPDNKVIIPLDAGNDLVVTPEDMLRAIQDLQLTPPEAAMLYEKYGLTPPAETAPSNDKSL